MGSKGINGITIEINGKTEKLQKALSGVNEKTRETQSELKKIERLLKLDPKNTELLAQKQKLLKDAISEINSVGEDCCICDGLNLAIEIVESGDDADAREIIRKYVEQT